MHAESAPGPRRLTPTANAEGDGLQRALDPDGLSAPSGAAIDPNFVGILPSVISSMNNPGEET